MLLLFLVGPFDLLTLLIFQYKLFSSTSIQDLAVSTATSELELMPGAVVDLSLLQNTNVDTTVAAASFTSDMTSPTITSFAVNMDLGLFIINPIYSFIQHIIGTFTLNFDKPVNASTIDVTAVTAHGQSSALSYQLTTSSTTLSGNGLQIVLSLSAADLDATKALLNAFTSSSNSYVTISAKFIKDMSRNSVNPIVIKTSQFTADQHGPSLSAFDLNVNGASAYIILRFSETVNVASIDLEEISIQALSTVSDAHLAVSLGGSVIVTSSNSSTVKIDLSPAVQDALKVNRIALTRDTAWLVLSAQSVNNVADLAVTPRVNGIDALLVSDFTPDTEKAKLLGFDIDMNAGMLEVVSDLFILMMFHVGTLTFDFSEPVDVATLRAYLLRLQNSKSP